MASAPLSLQVPLRWVRPAQVAPPLEAPAECEQLRQLRASLGEQGRQLWSGRELLRRIEKESRGARPTALAPLDKLLGGGLPKGKLLELTGARCSGRWSAVMAMLASVTGCGEPAALIDHGSHFDPQFGSGSGIELERLLWVAPLRMKDCVAAAELLLAAGFPLVALDLGLRLRGARVPEASWIRLARAAASYGAALVVSSPFPICGTAVAGLVRSARGRPRWSGGAASVPLLVGLDSRFTIERHREIREGVHQSIPLENGFL